MNRWIKYGLIGCGALSVLGVLLVGLVMAVVLLSGPGNTGDGTTSQKGAAQEEGVMSCQTEEACDLGASAVKVTKAEMKDGFTTRAGNFEGNFVVIEFDYIYGGTKPATMPLYSWKIEDGDGRTYNYSSDETLEYAVYRDLILEAHGINPGTTKSGAIVFEVAPDAENFTLHLRDLVRPRASKRADVPLG